MFSFFSLLDRDEDEEEEEIDDEEEIEDEEEVDVDDDDGDEGEDGEDDDDDDEDDEDEEDEEDEEEMEEMEGTEEELEEANVPGVYSQELAELTSEISVKTKLIEELELSQRRLDVMKHHYEEKLLQLQERIRATTEERDKVLAGSVLLLSCCLVLFSCFLLSLVSLVLHFLVLLFSSRTRK